MTETPKLKLYVRGKIDSRSPVYSVCTNNDRSVFKTLMSLAEDAVAVRSQIDQLQDGDHPLERILKGMKNTEAMVYMLGITRNSLPDNSTDSSEGTGKTATYVKNPVSPTVLKIQGQGEVAQMTTDMSWDSDIGDAFDALSGVPDLTN